MLTAPLSCRAGRRAGLWLLIPLQLVVLVGTGYGCLVHMDGMAQHAVSMLPSHRCTWHLPVKGLDCSSALPPFTSDHAARWVRASRIQAAFAETSHILNMCRIVYMVVAGTNMKSVWDLYKPVNADGESPPFGLSCWILVFFSVQLFLSQARHSQIMALLPQNDTHCRATNALLHL